MFDMLAVQNLWLCILASGLDLLACACFVAYALLSRREPVGSLWKEIGAGVAAAMALWSADLIIRLLLLDRAPTLIDLEAALFSLLPTVASVVAALRLAASQNRIARTLGAGLMLVVAALIAPLAGTLAQASSIVETLRAWNLAQAGTVALLFALPALALVPQRETLGWRGMAAMLLLTAGLQGGQLLRLVPWPFTAVLAPFTVDDTALGVTIAIALNAVGTIGLFLLVERLLDGESRATLARIAELRDDLSIANTGLTTLTQSAGAEKRAMAEDYDKRLTQVTAAANIATFEWDLQAGKASFGNAWLNMLGYAQQNDVLRKSVDPWLRLSHPLDLASAQRLLQELVAGKREQVRCELRMRSASGAWLWMLLSARIADWQADGVPRRVLGALSDINAVKIAEQALVSERSLFSSGPVIVLRFEGAAPYRLNQFSSNLQEARGMTEDASPLGQPLAELLHPEDAPGVTEFIGQAIGHPDTHMQHEVRLARADGSWPWYLLHMGSDKSGEQAQARAYLVNINSLKEAELQANNRTNALHEVVRRLDRNQFLLKTLQQLTELLQLCESEAESRQVIVCGGSQLFPGWSGAVTFADNEGLMEVAVRWGESFPLKRSDEVDCWAVRRGRLHQTSADGEPGVSPVCGHFGGGSSLPPNIKHAICAPLLSTFDRRGALHLVTAEPVSEEELGSVTWGAEMFASALKLSLANLRLRASLQEQAVRDGMTDLYNRRHFDELLRREMSRSQRTREGLILALLDIDKFKNFNDTFGHEAGDKVIKAVADHLRRFARAYDVACRVGGEEFALVMPRVHVEEAGVRLNQLREQINTCSLMHGTAQLPPVSVSIGVAGLELEATATPDDLLRRADAAMYAAKHEGRNRVKCWNPALEAVAFGALGAQRVERIPRVGSSAA